jgi:hypothetical protein
VRERPEGWGDAYAFSMQSNTMVATAAHRPKLAHLLAVGVQNTHSAAVVPSNSAEPYPRISAKPKEQENWTKPSPNRMTLRRCTVIYCVDAGGDSPPSAAGLSEALTLAREVLGVEVKLTAPWSAEPGGGPPLKPETALSRLNATLSNGPIIRGKITYPPESGVEKGVEGTLIVAEALLWPKMSYPVLSYAAQHPVFPHDSTGDQWFDDGQFSAYTQLGRELAPLARAEKNAQKRAMRKHPAGAGGPANLSSQRRCPRPSPTATALPSAKPDRIARFGKEAR